MASNLNFVLVSDGPHRSARRQPPYINFANRLGSFTDYHRQIPNYMTTYDTQWMRIEDETLILGGSEDGLESTMMSIVDEGGMSENFIGKFLKLRKPCKEDKKEDKVCAVCLDDLGHQESGDVNIGILDCSHEFHAGCIRKWLRKKNVCPLCKGIALG